MRQWLPILALCGLAAPALAQEPLNAEAFDALTRGKVMDTWSGGQIYGVEKFLPGGRSIWEDQRGCMYGTWKQVGEMICFSYEDDPSTPDCWTYFETEEGLSAQLDGNPEAAPIYLTPSAYTMTCNEYLGA
ncbi:hypothetical protein Q9295_05605 [Xinfangfangia sp. CPCC 101601]|uniref:DUF995 domain-containing protein n=1 Tax=Pseudogemmobacter lacusdianii TaxID=3069608 RepID=A0ABU0VVR7_9RHOB|nr:hypothetical protein [Xinfangfangia sp. CPCC 101601]MDQ2065837.1 hypothetical protein [Xinfangfangia sp. CPCC 101601]